MAKEEGVINELMESIDWLIDEIEDKETVEKMNSLFLLWKETTEGMKEFEKRVERIKTMIKIVLKEKKWDRYIDDKTKISVSITKGKKQSIDKEQLKMMLTDAQYAMVLKTTTFERMSILTPKMREKLKKVIK